MLWLIRAGSCTFKGNSRMGAGSGYTSAAIMAAALLAGSSAMAADAKPDAKHGDDLAKRWCSSCHLVESGQKQANADVPSFGAIAQKSDFTAEKVAYFLLAPHPKMPMPDFALTRTEAADLAAYISSLHK
jgi:mono/diheme cytochrome c family protein